MLAHNKSVSVVYNRGKNSVRFKHIYTYCRSYNIDYRVYSLSLIHILCDININVSDEINSIVNKISDETKYDIDKEQLFFYGLCEDCAE